MNTLVLIRHAETQPIDGISAHDWQLTEQGMQASQQLARQLTAFQLGAIYTSTEAKAITTGAIIAEMLNIPCQTAPDLQETRRDAADLLTREAFQQAVHTAMQQPDEQHFGEETFAAARDRFLNRTVQLLAAHPAESIALVSHGRVLSMVLAHLLGDDPVAIWSDLTMPDYLAFPVPFIYQMLE